MNVIEILHPNYLSAKKKNTPVFISLAGEKIFLVLLKVLNIGIFNNTDCHSTRFPAFLFFFVFEKNNPPPKKKTGGQRPT